MKGKLQGQKTGASKHLSKISAYKDKWGFGGYEKTSQGKQVDFFLPRTVKQSSVSSTPKIENWIVDRSTALDVTVSWNSALGIRDSVYQYFHLIYYSPNLIHNAMDFSFM